LSSLLSNEGRERLYITRRNNIVFQGLPDSCSHAEPARGKRTKESLDLVATELRAYCGVFHGTGLGPENEEQPGRSERNLPLTKAGTKHRPKGFYR
jgi:hypothetical protein